MLSLAPDGGNMATYFGENHAQCFDSNGNATGNQVSANLGFGNARCIVDTYSIAGDGDIGTNDTIRLGSVKLPKGVIVTDAILAVSEAFTTSGTISANFGIESSAAYFLQTMDLTSAVVTRSTRALSMGVEITDDTFIVMTNAASVITDGGAGTFTFMVTYVTV